MSDFKAYCKRCGKQVPGHIYGGAASTCRACDEKEQANEEVKQQEEKAKIRLAAARKFAAQNNISLAEALSLIVT